MAVSIQAGDVLGGKFRVAHIIGTGGMGMIVAARHLQLDRMVAVKFMIPKALEIPNADKRFVLEGRAAARLKSEHVARVLDVGAFDDGVPYIVMEYLRGVDLGQLLDEHGPLPVQDAVDYIIHACHAMREAHGYGIIHRDLKPANLFLTQREDGSPLIKVLDFGISKVVAPGGNVEMTQGTEAIGSPAYMSPEQAKSAKDVDARSDIWSLGAILYRLLSGYLPFMAESQAEVLAKVLYKPPEPLRDAAPWVPESLEDVILCALAKNPGQRYQTTTAFAAALAPFASADGRAIAEKLYEADTGQRLHLPVWSYGDEPTPTPSVMVTGPVRLYTPVPSETTARPISITDLDAVVDSMQDGGPGHFRPVEWGRRRRRPWRRAAAVALTALALAAAGVAAWQLWPSDRGAAAADTVTPESEDTGAAADGAGAAGDESALVGTEGEGLIIHGDGDAAPPDEASGGDPEPPQARTGTDRSRRKSRRRSRTRRTSDTRTEGDDARRTERAKDGVFNTMD